MFEKGRGAKATTPTPAQQRPMTNGSTRTDVGAVYLWDKSACVCWLTSMLQETMSSAEKRNSRDIPCSCCRCWEGILQDGEGFSPHKGGGGRGYLRSPHCLDDTETCSQSSYTPLINLAAMKQEEQNWEGLGHDYNNIWGPKWTLN